MPACFFIGKFLDSFFQKLKGQPKWYTSPKPIAILFLLFCMIPVSVGKLVHRMSNCLQMQYFISGRIIDSLAEKQDLILVSDYDQPEVIYYSNRKGWHITPDKQSIERIKKYRKKGVKYYTTTKLNEFNSNTQFSKYILNTYL